MVTANIAVETPEMPVTGQILIYDVRGQELFRRTITTSSKQIDISTLPGGVYLVKLQGALSVQTGKLIKGIKGRYKHQWCLLHDQLSHRNPI